MEHKRMFSLLTACVFALTTAPCAPSQPIEDDRTEAAKEHEALHAEVSERDRAETPSRRAMERGSVCHVAPILRGAMHAENEVFRQIPRAA